MYMKYCLMNGLKSFTQNNERFAGACTYQEAEPYQATMRMHAKAFMKALRMAGFSLSGVVSDMPEDQYISSLTAETSGEFWRPSALRKAATCPLASALHPAARTCNLHSCKECQANLLQRAHA